MKTSLIFNPAAGTAERIKDFIVHLTGGQRCELRAVSREVDARRCAREALEEGCERLVVGGGDGTVSQVVNGIAPHFDAIELAVLPFGTGNDLARSLGLQPENMALVCEQVFGDRVGAIDVVRIGSGDEVSYCVNVANGGLGGRVASDVVAEDKRRWGSMAYWITSVTRLIDLEQFTVELTLDGESQELDSYGIAVANGRFVGGGFPIAPRAMLDDGLLDVTVIPVLPPVELLAAGMNYTLGRHERGDRIRGYRARQVSLRARPELPFSIDGEPSQRLDADFEVLHRALRVVGGALAPGLGTGSNAPFGY